MYRHKGNTFSGLLRFNNVTAAFDVVKRIRTTGAFVVGLGTFGTRGTLKHFWGTSYKIPRHNETRAYSAYFLLRCSNSAR